LNPQGVCLVAKNRDGGTGGNSQRGRNIWGEKPQGRGFTKSVGMREGDFSAQHKSGGVKKGVGPKRQV